MAQIKFFNEFFETQPKQVEEAKETKGKVVDISYLASLEVEKAQNSFYAKLSKEFTKTFGGKKVMFMGSTDPGSKQTAVMGVIVEIEVGKYLTDSQYVYITMEDGKKYENIKELAVL
jgi:hypothetical protein